MMCVDGFNILNQIAFENNFFIKLKLSLKTSISHNLKINVSIWNVISFKSNIQNCWPKKNNIY